MWVIESGIGWRALSFATWKYLWVKGSRNVCIIYTAVAAVVSNGVPSGEKSMPALFSSLFPPLCQIRVLHMPMVTELFPALAFAEGWFPYCGVALLV